MTRSICRTMLALIPMLAVASGLAAAQELRRAEEGQLVRVQQHSGRWVTGTLVSAGPDLVVIEREGVRREFPSAQLAGTYVAAGRHRGRGAVMGLTYGGLGGLLLGALIVSNDDCSSSSCMQFIDAEVVIAGFAGLGAIGGTIIGAIAAPTRWVPASLNAVAISPARMPDGSAGAVMQLRF